MMLTALIVFGTMSSWAAGYTRTLNENLEVAGYTMKAFYNFQTNTPEVLPTTGDLRYRDGGIWGLHNFGSGTRNASVAIPVAKGDILVVQHYSNVVSTIDCGSLNENLTSSVGFQVYDITSDADAIKFTIARWGGLVAALVMEKDASVTTAEYTINYFYDEENAIVKTVTGEAIVGSSIVTEASFVVEDTKYIRVDGEPESFDIAAEGNTFQVDVRKAEKFAWTAKSNVGDFTASGETFEGDNANISFPRYLLHEGKLWTKTPADNKSPFNVSYVVDSDNMEFVLEYTETDIEAIFLTEAEDVEGMTVINSGNAEARSSKRAAAYAKDGNVQFTTLPAGHYILKGDYYAPSSGGGHPQIKAGDFAVVVVDATVGNGNVMAFSGEFKLGHESKIYFGKGGGNNAAFDYIYIQKVDVPAEEMESLIEAANVAEKQNRIISIVGEFTGGWDNDVKMTQNADNLDLYTLVVDGFNAEAKTYEYKLRADNQWGIYELPAEGNKDYYFPQAGVYKLTFTANVAEHTLSLDVEQQEVTVTAFFKNTKNWEVVKVWAWNDTENFTGGSWPGVEAVKTDQQVDGFDIYKWSYTGNTLPSLIIFNNGNNEQTADLKFIDGATYDADGNVTTGVKTVKAAEQTAAIYNLQGQRVMNAQKGLFIVNGKKVVLK